MTLRDSSSELFRALQHLHDTRNYVQQSEVDAVLSSQSRDAHASTVYLFMNEAHQSQRNYVLSAQSTNQRCGGIVWTKYVQQSFSEPLVHESLTSRDQRARSVRGSPRTLQGQFGSAPRR